MKNIVLNLILLFPIMTIAQSYDVNGDYKISGSVGIGTSTPDAKLDVNGNIKAIELIVNKNNTSTRYPIIGNLTYSGANEFGGYSVLPHFQIKNNSGPAIVHQFWAKDGSGNLRFFNIAFNAETKTLGFSGQVADASVYFNHKVGIGTLTTGSHKLAVEGSIGAREVKVEVGPGWSDFVFENDYELRTLEEVEDYITQNKHLPEIPSEAEVTENGINLGEMDAKLLQKIEELTLYLIEQNKEIKELKEKVQLLENQ